MASRDLPKDRGILTMGLGRAGRGGLEEDNPLKGVVNGR